MRLPRLSFPSAQTLSQTTAITVLVIGCIVIMGWLFNIATLKSVLPGLVTMKANTAIGFILSGLSLWFWHRHPPRHFSQHSAQLWAFLVLLLGVLTLLQYIFPIDFGIDQLIFKESVDAIATAAPGRMAPNTALNFFLIGSALLLLCHRRPQYLATHFFTIVSFLIAFLGLLGYLYGNAYFYHYGETFTAMALHTAITFILTCISIIIAHPQRGLMVVITMDNAGGILARRLFLAAILIPPLISWVILLGYRYEIYTPEMETSLFRFRCAVR